MRAVDLNGDAGEVPEALADGGEEAFLRSLTSASVACGGHAGDAVSMAAMAELCRRLGVRLGAHPSYPDRAGFGRSSMPLAPAEVEEEVARQVASLGRIARANGVALRHLKPHGALYHDASVRPEIARAVACAAARWSRELVLFAAARSPALDLWRASGFAVAAEAFADRLYEPDGSLRSRKREGAVIEDPAAAAAQALRIVSRGEVVASNGTVIGMSADSICVHGDTRGAVAIARAVREALRDHLPPRVP